jgi:hypothetical protein
MLACAAASAVSKRLTFCPAMVRQPCRLPLRFRIFAPPLLPPPLPLPLPLPAFLLPLLPFLPAGWEAASAPAVMKAPPPLPDAAAAPRLPLAVLFFLLLGAALRPPAAVPAPRAVAGPSLNWLL